MKRRRESYSAAATAIGLACIAAMLLGIAVILLSAWHGMGFLWNWLIL